MFNNSFCEEIWTWTYKSLEKQLERCKLLCSPQWGVNTDNPRMTITGLKFKLLQDLCMKTAQVVQHAIWLPTLMLEACGIWKTTCLVSCHLTRNQSQRAQHSTTTTQTRKGWIQLSSTEFKNNNPLKWPAWVKLIL